MSDISIGFSLLLLLQQLGGAVFTSVGETVLNNVLISQLTGVPGLDGNAIVDQGITDLASIVPSQYMVVVQESYNKACTRIFLVCMGLTLVGALSSLGLEWKSIKKGKNGHGPSHAPTEKNVSGDEKGEEDKKERTEGDVEK